MITGEPNAVSVNENYNVGETRLRLAQATGNFYTGLLDTLLQPNDPESLALKLHQQIENVPIHAQAICREGLTALQTELQMNNGILEQHRGEEVRFLLETALKAYNNPQEVIDNILAQSTPDKITYLEPSAGISVLEIDSQHFRFLQQQGLINADGEAAAFCSNDRNFPSFLVLQKYPQSRSLVEGGLDKLHFDSLKHETHHIVWSFLKRSGFIPKGTETDPQVNQWFGRYQDEFCAHILNNRSIQTVEAKNLIRDENEAIGKRVGYSKYKTTFYMNLGRIGGVESSAFLYAAMTAQNFDELDANVVNLSPVPNNLTPDYIGLFYDEWTVQEFNQTMGINDPHILQEFLNEHTPKITLDSIRTWAKQALIESSALSPHQLSGDFQTFKRFLIGIGCNLELDDSVLNEAIAMKFSD